MATASGLEQERRLSTQPSETSQIHPYRLIDGVECKLIILAIGKGGDPNRVCLYSAARNQLLSAIISPGNNTLVVNISRKNGNPSNGQQLTLPQTATFDRLDHIGSIVGVYAPKETADCALKP